MAATSSSIPWSTRKAPWYSTIGRREPSAGRPSAAASRSEAIGPGVSGRQAGGQFRSTIGRRDAEPPGDLVGHRGGRGQDARGLADEPALASPDERPERPRQLHQPGRLGVQVGDVVDEAAVPAGRPADRGAGDGQGDQRLRVDDLGARRGRGDRSRPRRSPRRTVARISRPRRSGARSRSSPRAGPTGSASASGTEAGRPQHGRAHGAGQRSQAARDPSIETHPAELDPFGERGLVGQAVGGEGDDRDRVPVARPGSAPS